MGKRTTETERRRTRVVATGTFDLIHPGHLFYLAKSREYGNYLDVIVARDSTPTKKPIIPEKQRKKVVQSLNPVDEVHLGYKEDKFKIIKEIQPDVITIGPDQKWEIEDVRTKVHSINEKIRVIKIEKYRECELCSTSEIIKRIKSRY